VKIISRILEAFRQYQTFCVVGHIRPDGDCIGSQLAMTLALREQGKEVVCWNEDPVPAKLAFLDPKHLLQAPSKNGAPRSFDCVLALDSASLKRLGGLADLIHQREVLINIDHHESNTRYGDINWVSDRAPATGELIYRLLKEARWAINRPMADCLFTAVSTDTGSYQYSTTTPTTFHVSGELVQRGADLAGICTEVYQSYSLSRVHLVKHLYNHFRLTHSDRTAYLWLKKADFTRTGANTADSEGLIDHIRAIEPVVVACLFEELEADMTRLSLRSKSDNVNVNEIAALFGGGGHPAAAGARVRGNPIGVQRRVLAAIKKALNGVKR